MKKKNCAVKDFCMFVVTATSNNFYLCHVHYKYSYQNKAGGTHVHDRFDVAVNPSPGLMPFTHFKNSDQ